MVLANLPASVRDRRQGMVVGLALAVLFVAAAPFATRPLAPFPDFILMYQAVLVVIDALTTALLVGQLRVTRSRGTIVLASGYVFAAWMTLAHGLSFPDAFTEAGLLGGRSQTTTYLYVLWHLGFPLYVIRYALRSDAAGAADGSTWKALIAGTGGATLLALAFVLASTVGHDFLPMIGGSSRNALVGRAARWMVALVTLVALALVWRRKRQTILDVWVAVTLVAWFIEVALASVLSHMRFDLGFYVGRTIGLLGSGVVMIVLLNEQAKLYASALEAQRALKLAADLRESRDVLTLAMRAGRMGVWSRDLVADRVWWSEELEEIFGLAPGSFAGTRSRFLDVVHPDDRATQDRAVADAIATHGDYAVEFRFLHASGEWRWMEGRGRAVYDSRGTPVMLHGLGMDVTARKRAEQALVESEARFRTLADNIAQFAWMADPGGDITWFNKRWYDYTGTVAEDVVGWGWQRVHHPDHVDRVVTRVRECFRKGETWNDIFPLRARDGTYRWFLSSAIPIRDEHGRVLRWFGTHTDVTPQREASDALREMDRRKDEFLAILAHELRNPLAPLINALEITRQPDVTPETLAWARDLMERQVRHMTRLVDDLIDVSRVTRGVVELRPEPVTAQAIVQRAVETSMPLIARAGLALDVDLPNEPLDLVGDISRLTQAVANLLNNAARYTPRGGRVRVALSRDDDRAVLRVTDSGIGIAPELRERIFDMFAQGPQSRGQGGLGIGLTLARTLVQRHDGTLDVESEGAGKGSTFTLRLPLAPEAALPEPIAASGARPAAPRRRVLVVDDNVDAALSLEMLLGYLGHEVAVAHEGQGAIELTRTFKPDVIFLDIALPGMSGYDVARNLRTSGDIDGVRLVAVTGYGQSEDRRKTLEAGFDAHLVKPVSLSAIADAIA